MSGIQTRKFFYPLNMQPCYSNNNIVKNVDGDFQLSEKFIMKVSLYHLVYIDQKEQFYVIGKIKEFYANRIDCLI